MSKKTSCTTVTALRARAQFLVRQFQATALFQLQLMRKLISEARPTSSESRHHDERARLDRTRSMLVKIRDNDDIETSYRLAVTNEYESLPELIRLAAHTTADLARMLPFLKIYSDGSVVDQPLRRLYRHLVQLLFERPRLLEADDANGSNVNDVRTSLDIFITTCVTLKHTPTLTSATLSEHEMATGACVDDDDAADQLEKRLDEQLKFEQQQLVQSQPQPQPPSSQPHVQGEAIRINL